MKVEGGTNGVDTGEVELVVTGREKGAEARYSAPIDMNVYRRISRRLVGGSISPTTE